MNLKYLLRASFFSFFITIILVACGSIGGILEEPEPEVSEDLQLPHKVAILPFGNHTSNPEAATIVRKMFYNFFSSLNYRDLEPYVIDDNLKINHLYAGITAGENISPQKLGQLLGLWIGHGRIRR